MFMKSSIPVLATAALLLSGTALAQTRPQATSAQAAPAQTAPAQPASPHTAPMQATPLQTAPPQTSPATRTAPTPTAPPENNAGNHADHAGDANGRVTFKTSNGTHVTVTSYQPSSKEVGPPPAYATLDINGNGSIDSEEAASYPPLANDFDYADSNKNGSISKSEYERWVKQP